jgi:hypothetical protein
VIGGGGARGDADVHADVSEARAEAGPQAPDADANASDDADANASDGTDASEVPVQSICPAHIPALAVPSGPVTGVLSGPSNNPIVSCQGGIITDGPDAFYTMTLTKATTVDLRVTAPVETVIAVRGGPCSDSISEIACGHDPALDVLPTGAAGDAGFRPFPVPFPPGVTTGAAEGDGRRGILLRRRVELSPGRGGRQHQRRRLRPPMPTRHLSPRAICAFTPPREPTRSWSTRSAGPARPRPRATR